MMNKSASVSFRMAGPDDVPAIHKILNGFAAEHLLLPRTEEDLLFHIGNFRIAEVDGSFAGCCAMRDYGGNLFEIRSLAIDKRFSGAGLGSSLVKWIMDQASTAHPGARLFALTYRYQFFERLGFRIVDKTMFPQKIWSDCSICSKFDKCDETAVLFQL